MSEPFLILHKVRSEPAFDVAIKMTVDGPTGEECWIIPTSGHRAYPYRWWDLQDIRDVSDINQFGHNLCPTQYVNAIPSSWPDHYACNDRPLREDVYTVKQRAAGLLEGLGLVKKVKVERRI